MEPVARSHKNGYHQDGVVQAQGADALLVHQQVILSGADGPVGLSHDPQVDGVQGQLGEDTGEDCRNAAGGVEQAGDQSRQHTRQKRPQHRQRHRRPRHGQHDEGGAAGSHGAVHRQVGHVQDPERDVDADGHDAPDQSLGGNTRQGVDQMHDVQVKSLQNPPAVSGGNLLLYSSKVQRKGEAPFPLKVC